MTPPEFWFLLIFVPRMGGGILMFPSEEACLAKRAELVEQFLEHALVSLCTPKMNRPSVPDMHKTDPS